MSVYPSTPKSDSPRSNLQGRWHIIQRHFCTYVPDYALDHSHGPIHIGPTRGEGGIPNRHSLSRPARSPDPARAKRVLGESRADARVWTAARDVISRVRAIPPKIKESDHVAR